MQSVSLLKNWRFHIMKVSSGVWCKRTRPFRKRNVARLKALPGSRVCFNRGFIRGVVWLRLALPPTTPQGAAVLGDEQGSVPPCGSGQCCQDLWRRCVFQQVGGTRQSDSMAQGTSEIWVTAPSGSVPRVLCSSLDSTVWRRSWEKSKC